MKEKRIRTIGIASSARSGQTTHLSVALANYAASGLNEKTAYLELYDYGEMIHWKEVNEKGYFTDYNIHYYPKFKREQIPILLNCDYEKIIMDFGEAYSDFREEILRCDRKIFLLSLDPWQEFTAKKMVNRLQNKNWGNIQPFYIGMNLLKPIKKKVEKDCGIEIMEIPFMKNPRVIQSEEFSCMNFILDSCAVKTKRKKTLLPIWKKR